MSRFTLLSLFLPAVTSFNVIGARVSGLSTSHKCVVQPHAAWAGRGACMMADEPKPDVAPEVAAKPAAYIEFIVGYPEPVVPDVSLTRSRDGSNGVATFTFDNPSFLAASTQSLGETTGMFLIDEEGTLQTNDVTATFVNGRPRIVKGVLVMRGADEWDRFMRYMERYAASNELGFSKA